MQASVNWLFSNLICGILVRILLFILQYNMLIFMLKYNKNKEPRSLYLFSCFRSIYGVPLSNRSSHYSMRPANAVIIQCIHARSLIRAFDDITKHASLSIFGSISNAKAMKKNFDHATGERVHIGI